MCTKYTQCIVFGFNSIRGVVMSKFYALFSFGFVMAGGLTACGVSDLTDEDGVVDTEEESGDPSDPSDPADPEDPEPSVFAPVAGDWLTTEEEMLQDNCKMTDYVSDGPGDTFSVSTPTDGRVEIHHGLGFEDCVLTDQAFECAVWSLEDTTPQDEYGLNATITIDVMTSGSFPSEEDIEMDSMLRANCSGPDCWLVELTTASMPCTMELFMVAEAL
jgi:hypothetical protein